MPAIYHWQPPPAPPFLACAGFVQTLESLNLSADSLTQEDAGGHVNV